MEDFVDFFEGNDVYFDEIERICSSFVKKDESTSTMKKKILKGKEKDDYIMVNFGNLYSYIEKKFLNDIQNFLSDPSKENLSSFISKMKFYDNTNKRKLIFKINNDETKKDTVGSLGTYLFTYDPVSHDIVKKNDFFVTTFLDMSLVRKLVQQTNKKVIWTQA